MNHSTPPDEIIYTPSNAIRLAIKDLQGEIRMLRVKHGDADQTTGELIADLKARIVALDEAERTIKAADAMKLALRGLLMGMEVAA